MYPHAHIKLISFRRNITHVSTVSYHISACNNENLGAAWGQDHTVCTHMYKHTPPIVQPFVFVEPALVWGQAPAPGSPSSPRPAVGVWTRQMLLSSLYRTELGQSHHDLNSAKKKEDPFMMEQSSTQEAEGEVPHTRSLNLTNVSNTHNSRHVY